MKIKNVANFNAQLCKEMHKYPKSKAITTSHILQNPSLRASAHVVLWRPKHGKRKQGDCDDCERKSTIC